MLYISRRIGQASWGVIDTDDYSETVCKLEDLEAAVIVAGLEIKGVTLGGSPIVDGILKIPGSYIEKIDVYQDPKYSSSLQAKVAMLYGVVVKTLESTIVGIDIPSGLKVQHVYLRLSDFGKSCGDSMLQMIHLESHTSLSIILDDKISITRRTFSGLTHCDNILLDVREVTNKRTIDNVYLCDCFLRSVDAFVGYMLDSQSRLDLYKGVRAVEGIGISKHNRDVVNDVQTLLYFPVKDMSRTSSLVSSYYEKEFLAMASAELLPKHITHYSGYIDMYIQDGRVRGIVNNDDYAYCWGCRNSVFFVLNRLTTMSAKGLSRLLRYHTLFEASDVLKRAYVDLCKNVVKFLDAEYRKLEFHG